MKDIKKIIENKLLESNVSERKEFGEVFTPFSLIDDMLDKIPDDVWKDKTLKWLDPCVGIGNFTVCIIERLMKFLDIQNEEERYNHIVNNMLYVCDIQETSIKFVKDNFGIKNIYNGSFLDTICFENIIFDIVVANPPYNGATETNKTNGNMIWDEFVVKSFNISERLLFVHPSIWRKPLTKNSKVKDLLSLFKTRNLKYLNINSLDEGKKIFNAGTRFDYYYLDNSIYEKTLVNDEKCNEYLINIKYMDFIPNFDIIEVYEHLKADNNIIFNSSYHGVNKYISDVKNEEFCFPLIHSTPKKGIVYKYSNRNDKGHFGIPKIIIGESGVDNLVIDIDGIYGMTQGAMGIVIKNIEEGETISKFLKSEKFKSIIKSCMFSNFRIDSNVIKKINFFNI